MTHKSNEQKTDNSHAVDFSYVELIDFSRWTRFKRMFKSGVKRIFSLFLVCLVYLWTLTKFFTRHFTKLCYKLFKHVIILILVIILVKLFAKLGYKVIENSLRAKMSSELAILYNISSNVMPHVPTLPLV